jgi:hypothetical protein
MTRRRSHVGGGAASVREWRVLVARAAVGGVRAEVLAQQELLVRSLLHRGTLQLDPRRRSCSRSGEPHPGGSCTELAPVGGGARRSTRPSTRVRPLDPRRRSCSRAKEPHPTDDQSTELTPVGAPHGHRPGDQTRALERTAGESVGVSTRAWRTAGHDPPPIPCRRWCCERPGEATGCVACAGCSRRRRWRAGGGARTAGVVGSGPPRPRHSSSQITPTLALDPESRIRRLVSRQRHATGDTLPTSSNRTAPAFVLSIRRAASDRRPEHRARAHRRRNRRSTRPSTRVLPLDPRRRSCSRSGEPHPTGGACSQLPLVGGASPARA